MATRLANSQWGQAVSHSMYKACVKFGIPETTRPTRVKEVNTEGVGYSRLYEVSKELRSVTSVVMHDSNIYKAQWWAWLTWMVLVVFQAIYHDGFWKSDHDFLIAFHSNFLSAIHGFRDNEVLLQAGFDVIMISPPGGDLRNFSWRILKERLRLPDSVL